MLTAKIKNFSYKKELKECLEKVEYKNINDLPSKCLIEINNKIFALSKWVSPKRTRSYPYARVYDTFDCPASKIVTIIPLIKDEGINGDMDYLQWDTISLMSLLNVYVILGFYNEAKAHNTRENKITKQEFDNVYIAQELEKLCNYHQSALHWNLNQLDSKNLAYLIQNTKNSYANISNQLNIKMHDLKNIDNFAKKIAENKKAFMNFSRTKAAQAQNAEAS